MFKNKFKKLKNGAYIYNYKFNINMKQFIKLAKQNIIALMCMFFGIFSCIRFQQKFISGKLTDI